MAQKTRKKDEKEGLLFGAPIAGPPIGEHLLGWRITGTRMVPYARAKKRDLEAAGKEEQKPQDPQKAVEASIELHGKLNPGEARKRKQKQG